MSLSKQELAKIKKLIITEGLASNDVASILNYEDDFILQKKWELADAIIQRCLQDEAIHDEIWRLLGLPLDRDEVDGPALKISGHPLEKYIDQVELTNTKELMPIR